jgi:2-keto-4-pentenoate hydratase
MTDSVSLLLAAATGGPRVEVLHSKPSGIAQALAQQDELVARSGRNVAGWKVSTDATGAVMYGAIFADDCHPSPATLSVAKYPLMGIEGEIAYRFTADLPAGGPIPSREELARILEPFPAMEIVDSRFLSYKDTPLIDRLVDRMSNGGMVIGRATGRSRSFEQIGVKMAVDGVVTLDQRGGHTRKDPFLPAIDFITTVHGTRSFAAGQFITTGTYTGLAYGKAGQHIVIDFEDFGRVELTVAA